jgi:hypothetical protein
MTIHEIQKLQQALETIESVTGYSPKYLLWLLEKDDQVFTDEERESILAEILKVRV